MPIEQEPIKIEIPVEEDEVVMVPERSSPDAAQRVSAGAQHMAMRARDTWQSEKRRQTQAVVQRNLRRGLRRGGRVSRVGLVRGLDWLSDRLAKLAERFTPVDQN